MVFNDFSRFGGSKSASFLYVFRVSVPRSFFNLLGVGFGIDFGAVWVPNGSMLKGLGLVWGRCWDGFLGRSGIPGAFQSGGQCIVPTVLGPTPSNRQLATGYRIPATSNRIQDTGCIGYRR